MAWFGEIVVIWGIVGGVVGWALLALDLWGTWKKRRAKKRVYSCPDPDPKEVLGVFSARDYVTNPRAKRMVNEAINKEDR